MEIDDVPPWSPPSRPPLGLKPSQPSVESPSPMVGSKRPLSFLSATAGPRTSPRIKKQFMPVYFNGDPAFSPFPDVSSASFLPAAPFLPPIQQPLVDSRSVYPVTVECSRYEAHGGGGAGVSRVDVLVVKAEYAPLGSGGGLVGLGSDSQRCRDAWTVAYSLLCFRCAELSACVGRPECSDMRPVQVRLEGPSLSSVSGASPGCAMFMALMQLYLGVGFKPRVAVTGEVSLTGRIVSTGGVAAKVRAALAAGMACVVVAVEDEGEVERDLMHREKACVVYARDVLDLLQHTVSGFFERQPEVDLESDVGVGPTLLPFDDVLVAFRWVEAAALPSYHNSATNTSSSNGGQRGGSFIMTGVQEDGNCVRSALNAARFLLLKQHAALTQLLGPPIIDLHTMRRSTGGGGGERGFRSAGSPVDIHIHVPQPLHTAAYAVPALLALITVVWGKEPTSKTLSLGEVNILGRVEFKESLRPSFVSAVRMHRMRKVIIPRRHAVELVRELGGVGERWAGCGGVVVQGVDGLLDLVRHAFLGGDV